MECSSCTICLCSCKSPNEITYPSYDSSKCYKLAKSLLKKLRPGFGSKNTSLNVFSIKNTKGHLQFQRFCAGSRREVSGIGCKDNGTTRTLQRLMASKIFWTRRKVIMMFTLPFLIRKFDLIGGIFQFRRFSRESKQEP